MDTSPDKWKQIKDIVKCPVCYDMLNDAKFLPCGHTFCQNCLEECDRHQPSTIGMSCPMCKENSTVSSLRHLRAGLSDLPKNLIAQDVAEVVRKLTVNGNTEDATEATFKGLIAARPGDARPRPRMGTRLLGRACRFLPTIIRCTLVVLVFLAVMREEDKQHLSRAASLICREIDRHTAEEKKSWTVTAFFHQLSEELFGRKSVETKPETLAEKAKRLLKQASISFCGVVDGYRRRRRALYLSWIQTMDER